ncbi:sensor histidine kinase [Spirochaetia bacterium]|nr:sensor histidine kinase [Spirochaetia bacterium]
MISLRNRLSLTYALFMSASFFLLTVVVNNYVGSMFSVFAKNNIEVRSAEIQRAVADVYNPFTGEFDLMSVEAVGMVFTHEGYIVTVKDKNNIPLWDARSCDMQECNKVINDITSRMENEYRLTGGLHSESYPLMFRGTQVGIIEIETYRPYFYSETEKDFLRSLNKILAFVSGFFIFVSIVLSVLIALSIARPVRKAALAARSIADGNFDVRLSGNYHTTELHKLADSLNGMAAGLQEADRRQKQLTFDVAHELRTPLTCLQGNLEAMLDGVWAPTMERLASCREETGRLTKLVEDLSVLTNIEWHNITLDKIKFDLSGLLSVVAVNFEQAAKEKNIAVICDLPPLPVCADYDRIKQVFFNILSNAVKYTDKGSVTISGRQAQDEKGIPLCEVSIADTGIGIPKDELPHIFDRFYRTDKSRSRKTGGSGIGLTIAEAIVKAHGGAISAESTDSGTVFRVRLYCRF